jgi:hypothetical protein
LKKVFTLFFALLIISCFGFSQTGAGKITGTVVDPDGVAIPGVSIYLTGEKIGKMTAVTSEDGHFRFLNLPVGKNYEVRFEMAGFNTVVRSGIDIWIGSTTEVNITLEPATIEEQITVVARSPLVDTKSTTVARNVTADQVQLLPTSRNPWTLLMLAPGMLIDREDVGGSESGQQSYFYGYGAHEDDSTWRVDGANITDASAIGAAPAYLNSNAYEELQIAYGNNDITAQTGGVQINFVTKRAGNNFTGMFHLMVEDEAWQLDNIDAHPEEDLSPGYGSPGIFRLYMYGADFGGPLLKDHLFFYGSWMVQDIHSRTIVQSEDATWLVSGYGKINWQYGGNMGDVFMAYDNKLKWNRTALGAANQDPGTMWNQTGPGYLFRFADQQAWGDLLLQFRTIYTDGGFALDPIGNEIIGGIAQGDWWRLSWDPAYYWHGSSYHYETNRNQLNVSLDGNYFAENVLGADHEFRFGVDYVTADTTTHTYYPNQAMLYDYGGGYKYFEANTNGVFDVNFKRYSAYISDSLTFGKVNLMIGLRYDIEQGAHNAAEAPAFSLYGVSLWPDYIGQPMTAEAQDVDAKWKTLSPRLSLTYDITGDGKNVLKLAAARYGGQSGNSLAGWTWGVNVKYIAVPWADDGDNIPELGEFDTPAPEDAAWYGGFDRTDPYGPDPDQFDPDYNTPLIDELTLSFEREITSDFAASLSLFWKKRHRLLRTIGIMEDGSLETADNWYWAGTNATTGSEYMARYVVPVGRYRTNTEDSYTQYYAASLVLKKRFSNKWMLDASATWSSWKQHWAENEYNAGTQMQNDNQMTYNDIAGWDLTNYDYYNEGVVAPESGGSGYSDIFVNARWMVKVAALYQLPYEINLSAVFNAREGYVVPYYSTMSRPGGVGTTYIKEPGKKYGDDRLPSFWVLNLGLEKVFHVFENALVALHVDAYNVTNNATILKRNAVIGAAQDRIERFLNPAVFQFGIRFEF